MYFVASLLMHIAILLSLILVWVGHAKPVKQPSMYVPSYAYSAPAPSQPSPSQQSTHQTTSPKEPEKPQSGVVSTQAQIHHASHAATQTSSKVTEAINLVGDKNVAPKPLIKLLAKALTAHLIYPKIALDFRVRGIAYVGFVLHPDGTLSHIQIVQSSDAGVLDNEALTAVRAISPVANASQYLTQSKEMVIGIMFR